MPITVSDRFDSGAIEFLSASLDGQVELALRADSHADFRQWFHFRLQGARGLPLTLVFVNAGACTYVEGWRDYRVVASYDRRHWFRIDTTFDGQRMVVAHVPERDSVYYAYFEPYSEERHLELLGRVDGIAARPRVAAWAAASRGATSTSSPSARRGTARVPVWVIARQHPGRDDGRVVRRGPARAAARSSTTRWRVRCSSARCSTSCRT